MVVVIVNVPRRRGERRKSKADEKKNNNKTFVILVTSPGKAKGGLLKVNKNERQGCHEHGALANSSHFWA